MGKAVAWLSPMEDLEEGRGSGLPLHSELQDSRQNEVQERGKALREKDSPGPFTVSGRRRQVLLPGPRTTDLVLDALESRLSRAVQKSHTDI